MASREKRPLAPSKSKQKVNNDCASSPSSIDQKNRKGKGTGNARQQQIAQDILEAVATGSELPVKINASLPRKKAIKNLRRKPQLQTSKGNLIKVKITKKAPIRTLRKNNAETIRAVKSRRTTKKTLEEEHLVETQAENPDVKGTNVKSLGNSAVTNLKGSPKTGRKVRVTSIKPQNPDSEEVEDNTNVETEVKYNRVYKTGAAKRANKTVDDVSAGSPKNLRLKRNTSKERDVRSTAAADTKSIKAISDNKNLVDLTIDQVIASGPATEESQGSSKKLRRGRKVSERLLSESEIKKEPDTESDPETKGNQVQTDMSQSSSDPLKSTIPRTRYNRTSAHRSLRNGKLRGSSEFGMSADLEGNKQFGQPEDQIVSDSCAGDSSTDIIEGEGFFYESNLDNSRGNMNSTKGENDDENNGIEVGNNNNGERGERTLELGPTLRSKTKAKTTDSTATSLDVKSSSDVKAEEMKFGVKNSGAQDDLKKSTSLEHTRKENLLVNISDKPKSRRSSLNVEMKKTVNSFYGGDKTESPKSQIDQMIENIKLNIAKSIESKIFGPDNGLGLSKNFEIPKTEEIVAPLCTELQKKNNDDKDEEVNTPNNSKGEIKSENTENAVPKVADTAKKIEKMVMGDMEVTETQSQERQQNNDDGVFHDSENIGEGFSKSSETGNCSSASESNRNDDDGNKIEEISVKDIIEIQPQVGEGQARAMGVSKKVINTRRSSVSVDKSSIIVQKLGDCDKSQSLNPDVDSDCHKGKRLSIVLDKTLNTDEKYSLNKNATPSASGNKYSTQCTLDYEIFEQELKDGQKSSKAEPESNAAASDDTREDDSVGNDVCLNTTMQSEESESLESISREIEILVGESESASTKTSKSTKSSFSSGVEDTDERLPNVDSVNCENTKLSLENSEEFNDMVDADAETNRYLEVLESSFTDSDILTMAPEINEALASKELSRSVSVYSKETLDFEKFTQESADDAERRRNEKTFIDNQDTVYNYQSQLDGQEIIVSSKNVSINQELSRENAEQSSSQSSSHHSNINETMESQNSDLEKKSNGEELAIMSKDKNTESFVELDRSIENDRSSTVSGVSEKPTNSQEHILHVSSIETSCVDTSGGGGTMKKEIQVEQITAEEQTSLNEENKRVLRARDRLKKVESGRKSQETVHSGDIVDKMKLDHVKGVEETVKTEQVGLQTNDNSKELTSSNQNEPSSLNSTDEVEKTDVDKQETEQRGPATGPFIRTRRSREVKKRKDEQQYVQNVQKPKRSKRDNKKSDQQNKEETLLDNEVAEINENIQSLTEKYQKTYKGGGNFRGFSEVGSKNIFGTGKVRKNDNDRSHSETDLEMVKMEMENVELTKKRSENSSVVPEIIGNRSRNSETGSENEKKVMDHNLKTPDTKDIDETSTSSDASSSAAVNPNILETPEDKVKKESILRLLGLESLEKAAERMNHQKAKKEQYTGTLKTVIRVQKEKDKKRSRSPLKMVLKQGRIDGDGDSPEFYTIQKELGTSGLGESSSGANRKFSTNHRHSCDEDPDEPPSKDRQLLVIPEKSSSFSIHPGRLCADVCCYCFGKFGSLDTPMHLAQMKSNERRKKILDTERHLTKDSCLCDACYRHVDRKANTSPTNMHGKLPRQHRQLMVSKCFARECREPARHHVKRRWLLKIRIGLQNQVDIDWDSNQHTSMSFCVGHYSKIERFLACALCKRRLAKNHMHQLGTVEADELNVRLRQQRIPVPVSAGTYACKLCRYYIQLQLKYKDVENMNLNHKAFTKSYRKRILHYHHIEILENEEEDSSSQSQPTKDKEKRKRSRYGPGKSGSSKSLDSTHNSASEKSTPEPTKNEGMNFEADSDGFANQNSTGQKNLVDITACRDIQILSVEDSIENLKKRKSHTMQAYNNSTFASGSTNDLVEILAMDKEVTLTRLPKRARTNSDINPVVQRLGANPSISVRTLFPGEEEMNLHANVEFNNVREVTPQGWEKCATMIQYDRDTKLLWQELQRPYGNQSSFLRHLILLEKYYRSGDLVLAPNASRNAINYSTSVQNRLISYEGPEKVDEPILEPISTEFANPRRLSGGFMMERDRLSMPSTSSYPSNTTTISSQVPNSITNSLKSSPPRMLKLNSGVSIIKKPPPNLHRLNLPSTSTSNANYNQKRKDNRMPVMSGGKVFQLTEPEYKKLQNLKRQKQMLNDKQMTIVKSDSVSPSNQQNRPPTQYQKAQIAAQTQFQKHLRMQQEMLSKQSRSDFEPLICDVRSLNNESNQTQTQNLLSNLNLPKSIQVTTKPPNTIPMMPKIPKSLTVIPQTITRPTDNK